MECFQFACVSWQTFCLVHFRLHDIYVCTCLDNLNMSILHMHFCIGSILHRSKCCLDSVKYCTQRNCFAFRNILDLQLILKYSQRSFRIFVTQCKKFSFDPSQLMKWLMHRHNLMCRPSRKLLRNA